MIIDGNRLTPENGMWLSNGQTASQMVLLAVNDSASNWYEITAEEAEEILNPQIEEDLTDSEILAILLGEGDEE